jgi:hypothetical protein
MTLIEIMIALAIVVVMSSILVVASGAITGYLRAANDVGDRVAVQAPIAQARDIQAGTEIPGNIEIILSPTNTANDGTIPLVGKMYSAYGQEKMEQHANEAGGGLNMKFIVDIETTTVAPE